MLGVSAGYATFFNPLVACGLVIASTGCSRTEYTHIEETKNVVGIYRVRGEIWSCVPQGQTVKCSRLSEK